MGVYIKGMEMPKSCWSCDMPLSVLKCPVQTEEEAMRYCSCRHKDCPIVSVPPHGRLIDADALKSHKITTEEWFGCQRSTITVKVVFKTDVDKAPTIVPTEEGE